MSRPLRVGSLFAGIGGFDLAFERAGWEPAWQVEVDPRACAVLARHWPGVARYGDIRALDPADLAPVDALVGGFPCQDLSVAGKRAGLSGDRSGLFYEFIRVARALRPAVLLLENVPGFLSVNGGRDFGVALDALALLGALDIGWRVLDAQWFGVPQRRRRLFIVCDLGGRRAEQILALSEGLSGHPAPRRETGTGAAGDVEDGAGGHRRAYGGNRTSGERDVAAGLSAHGGPHGRLDFETETFVVEPVTVGFSTTGGGRGDGDTDDLSPPLRVGSGLGIPSPPGVVASREVAQSLTQAWGRQPDNSDTSLGPTLAISPVVRRLTPRECERLQGFPDDFTALAADGSPIADGPRYRMLGNAVCVPVVEWLARRLAGVMTDGRLRRVG